MKEKAFENKVKSFLKSQGSYFVKYFGCAYTQAGVPDLLVCCKGKFIGIELKGDKGKVSELQKYNIEQIKKAGGIGIVLYPKDFDSFKEMIMNL